MYPLKRFLWHKGFFLLFFKLHNFTQSVGLRFAGVQVIFNQAFVHGKVLSKYCWNDTFESRISDFILRLTTHCCLFSSVLVTSSLVLYSAAHVLRNTLLWKCIMSTLWGKALNGHIAQVVSLTLNKSCWMTLGTVSQLRFPFRCVNWKSCHFRRTCLINTIWCFYNMI